MPEENMADPICEHGFLVVESENGGLSGKAPQFYESKEKAESVAKNWLPKESGITGTGFPVFVVQVTRFTNGYIPKRPSSP